MRFTIESSRCCRISVSRSSDIYSSLLSNPAMRAVTVCADRSSAAHTASNAERADMNLRRFFIISNI